jgi:MFS family permease
VLWVACLTGFFEYASAAAISPFFAVYAAETTGASELLVGITFAAFPAAIALTSFMVPAMSSSFGRVPVLFSGLLVQTLSQVAFGSSSSIAYWIGFRALQGVGSAMVGGPATALLLAYSSDIGEDLGLFEAVTGGSYMIGPAIGGLLFKQLGFRSVFLALAAGNLIAMIAVAVVLRRLPPAATATDLTGLIDDGEAGGLADTDEADYDNIASSSKAIAPVTSFDRLARERTVWIVTVVAVLAFSNMAFGDLAWPQHFRATVGFGARDTGFAYVFPSALYVCITPFFGAINWRFGPRNVMAGGCACFAFSQFLCGPAPLLLSLGGGRSLAWWTMAPGLILFPFAIMGVTLTAIPLMDSALKAGGASPVSASFSGADKTALEDALSAVYQFAEAFGSVLGPILGGVALEIMPLETEPGCDFDDDTTCSSSFSWVTFSFAGLFLLASALVTALPSRKEHSASALPSSAAILIPKNSALTSPLLNADEF